jgi:hypothetical protein
MTFNAENLKIMIMMKKKDEMFDRVSGQFDGKGEVWVYFDFKVNLS